MINSVLFVIFFNLLYFHGRGIVLIFDNLKQKNLNLYTLPLNLFYPFISLFFIGNLTLILNFFLPVKSLFFQIFLFFPILFNFKKIEIPNYSVNNLIKYLFLPGILGLSTLSIGLAYDAGLYHLNSQLWIRESNVPIGLYNIHFRYGYSSLIEYISANFWLNNNFIILHFINLSFLSSFLNFIFYFITENENKSFKQFGYFIIIFGFFDNFGYSGGRNGFLDIEAVSKHDTPFAILFVLSNLFLIYIYKNKRATKMELFTISLLILFSIQMRVFGIITLILLIFTILKINWTVVKTTKTLLTSVVLGFIFTLKNILISGCMFFPVEISCFESLDWYVKKSASIEAESLASFHKSYQVGRNLIFWFEDWLSKPINKTTIINFLISFVLILIFKRLYYIKVEKFQNYFFIYIYYLILVIFWFMTAPGIRLGLGVFCLSFAILSLNAEKNIVRFKYFDKNIFIISGLVLVTFLMPRLENYEKLFVDPFRVINLEPKYPKYINNEYFGVTTENNDLCWIKINCISYRDGVIKRKIQKSEIGLFKVYRITN